MAEEKRRKIEKLSEGKYIFEGNIKNSESLCYILSGYKTILWDVVFERIKKFVPSDFDVCIVSSGVYNEKLSNIAKQNGWSYMSTKINNVCLAQNIVIKKFEKAKYIFKLDEDIFVTKGYFETILNLYCHLKEDSPYDVGVVAPMIPINGFSHVLVLDRFNLRKEYETKFEKTLHKAGQDRMIENNPEVAKFMWKTLPSIDVMNEKLQDEEFSYVPCPVKFSIGAIMFDRDFFNDMGTFYFKEKKADSMGWDENQLCSSCMLKSKPLIVSKNTLVGHLSFGLQNKAMYDFYKKNINIFEI